MTAIAHYCGIIAECVYHVIMSLFNYHEKMSPLCGGYGGGYGRGYGGGYGGS